MDREERIQVAATIAASVGTGRNAKVRNFHQVLMALARNDNEIESALLMTPEDFKKTE